MQKEIIYKDIHINSKFVRACMLKEIIYKSIHVNNKFARLYMQFQIFITIYMQKTLFNKTRVYKMLIMSATVLLLLFSGKFYCNKSSIVCYLGVLEQYLSFSMKINCFIVIIN